MIDEERDREVDRQVNKFQKNWNNTIVDNFSPRARIFIIAICYVFMYIQFLRKWIISLMEYLLGDFWTVNPDFIEDLTPWWSQDYLVDISFLLSGVTFFRILYKIFKEALEERRNELDKV